MHTMDPKVVKEAQSRVEQEAKQYLKFTFQAD